MVACCEKFFSNFVNISFAASLYERIMQMAMGTNSEGERRSVGGDSSWRFFFLTFYCHILRIKLTNIHIWNLFHWLCWSLPSRVHTSAASANCYYRYPHRLLPIGNWQVIRRKKYISYVRHITHRIIIGSISLLWRTSRKRFVSGRNIVRGCWGKDLSQK